jgi:hypothetical protein
MSLSACSQPDLKLVKEGTFGKYQTTTIGKAFDGSFDNEKWTTFEANKGERIVRFTGEISESLHNSVITSVAEELKGNINQKVMMMQVAFEKLRKEGDTILELNRVYRCSPEKSYRNLWVPNCDENDMNEKYLDAIIESFLDSSWVVGSPVEVDWIVHPNGKEFTLSHMASSQWGGVTHDDILDAIYD